MDLCILLEILIFVGLSLDLVRSFKKRFHFSNSLNDVSCYNVLIGV